MEDSVTPTQLLLSYMTAVGGKIENGKLLVSLDNVVDILSQNNIQTNIVFRGRRNEDDIHSETISNELWYWISNGFIEETSKSYAYSYTKKGKKYFVPKSKINERINWDLSEETKKILSESINTVINSRK